MLSSCSLLADLSPDQCGANADCQRFGSNYRCDDGICVAPTSGGRGGDGGSAGESNAATGGLPVAEAGAGGSADATECAVNRDCLELYGDAEPRVCRAQRCEKLFSTECPIALPQEGEAWLEYLYPQAPKPDPVIEGAFAFLPPQTPLGNQSRNYELALQEFNEVGLPASAGQRRQLVVVVCDQFYDDTSALHVPLTHLIDRLQVPGILAALPSDQLKYAIETMAVPKDVMVVSPLDSDRALASLEDDGLAWHLLPGGDYVSVTYAPLFQRAVSYLRRTRVLGTSENVKVALVSAEDDRYLSESSDTIYGSIRFNGDKSAAENVPNHFKAFEIESYRTAPDELHLETINGLVSFGPHVIFGIGADEFLGTIVPGVEARWAAAHGTRSKPFYLLSPVHFNNPELGDLIAAYPGIQRRMVGVNAASAADMTLYDQYFERLVGTFQGEAVGGYENYYDAAYHLFHATVAAGANANLTGTDLALGIRKLVVPEGTRFRVHPDDIQAVFSALAGAINPRLALQGTMGPPNFDVAKGARADAGSVFCVGADGTQYPDVLRYQDENTLSGTFPSSQCFAFDP